MTLASYIDAATLRKPLMAENKLIYFDNAATTKVNPEVLLAYNKVCETTFANASSIHFEGQKANRLLDKSRELILSSFGLKNTHQVIFTSGATEANNLAIKGFALKYQNRGKHILVSAVEHASVLEVAKQLQESFGFDVEYLPVDEKGHVDVSIVENAIKKDTILVSVMAVNNEVGAINDIQAIAKLLKQYPKIAFHVDATQAVGKINLKYNDVDMFTYSGHKIHGLKGNGALIKVKNLELLPINSGGGQEDGFRSGTNDVAGAVSLAKATSIAMSEIYKNKVKIARISTVIYEYLKQNSDLYEINSSEENPYIVNFSLRNKKASVIVEGLSNKNIMVSSISACHSKKEVPSHVLMAMNKGKDLSHNSVRISIDSNNTIEEAKTLIKELDELIKGVKQ